MGPADENCLQQQQQQQLLTLGVRGVMVKPREVLVVPALRTPDHWLHLTNLDRVVNPTFSSALLVFNNVLDDRSDQSRSFADIVENLKVSLSRVLVDFFPLAGRLELGKHDVVDLHCNDQGAFFFDVALDAELPNNHDEFWLQPMPELSGLDLVELGPGPKFLPNKVMTSIPVLVIQVTHFKKCGSLAVAVNWHHTVADGCSGCHFIRSWAEVNQCGKISVKPVHDREALRARSLLNPFLYSKRTVAANKSYRRNVRKQQVLPITDEEKLPLEPVLLKCFLIPMTSVQQLRVLAQRENYDFTSAEAISGFLWQRMTKARMDDESEEERSKGRRTKRNLETRFFMFVDGRQRLGLPREYFGNVVCGACATSSEEDILNHPVSFAADLIKRAVKNVTAEHFRSMIDWVEEHKSDLYEPEHLKSRGRDVAATFWTYFPLYEADFGWGRPTFATRNAGPRPAIDGIAMMPSPAGPGQMVALLNLHSDRMKRLQNDPVFSTVCLY